MKKGAEFVYPAPFFVKLSRPSADDSLGQHEGPPYLKYFEYRISNHAKDVIHGQEFRTAEVFKTIRPLILLRNSAVPCSAVLRFDWVKPNSFLITNNL